MKPITHKNAAYFLIFAQLLTPLVSLPGVALAQEKQPSPQLKQETAKDKESNEEGKPIGKCQMPSNLEEGLTSSPEWANYGHVTVGKPKIWSFDRIYSTLDGLLRDVDAVTVEQLAGLNPNSSNQALLDFLSTSFGVSAGYNQEAGVINSLELERVNNLRPTELKRLQSYNETQLYATGVRDQLNRQLAEVQARIAQLETKAPDYEASLKAENDKINAIKQQLDSVGLILAQAAPGVTTIDPKQLEAVPAPTPAPLPTPLFTAADFKDKIPFDSKSSLPATKKLDNFITLLHERLSRQLSVSFDDLSRTKDVYLVQFDVGVYPHKKAENHVLRVEFRLEDSSGKDDPLAYDLYPGVSSYNMTEYWGKSRGTGIAGGASFLLGFGLSAEYKRQRDQIRSSVTQSVYTAGFGAGTSNFGWYFGANPFEKLISPGNRFAYAVIVVDKDQPCLTIKPRAQWFSRNGVEGPQQSFEEILLPVPRVKLGIQRLAYQTIYSYDEPEQNKNNLNQNSPPNANDFGAVQITFKQPIDPNLVITVNGEILPRVRDVRGRAGVGKPASLDANNQGPKRGAFGLLEADDPTNDHWFALGAHSISLKLTRRLVGNEVFPRIRLLQAGGGFIDGLELKSLFNQDTDVLINNWTFRGKPPASVFLPLFSSVEYLDGAIHAWPDPRNRNKVFIERNDSVPADNTFASYAPLDEQTQVVAVRDETPLPLECKGFGKLACTLPNNRVFRRDEDLRIERSIKGGSLKGWASQADLANDKPDPHIRLTRDKYDIVRVVESDGQLAGWWLHLEAKYIKATDQIFGFSRLGPGASDRAVADNFTTTIEPKFSFVPDIGANPTYKEIKLWIPTSTLPEILNARLYLETTRYGETRRVELPRLAAQLLPMVAGVAQGEVGRNFIIRGDNLGLVRKVSLANCGKECRGIRTTPTGKIVAFSVPEKVNGAYPIILELDHEIKLEAAQSDGTPVILQLKPEEKQAAKTSAAKPKPKPEASPKPEEKAEPTTPETDKQKAPPILVVPPLQPKSTPTPNPADAERRARSKQTTVQ